MQYVFYSTHERYPHTRWITLHVFEISCTLRSHEVTLSFRVSKPSLNCCQDFCWRCALWINKRFTTLQQEVSSPKSRLPIDHQPNMVYKIPCRCRLRSMLRWLNRQVFWNQKEEHFKNVKTYASASNLAKYARTFQHCIDFEKMRMIKALLVSENVDSQHTAWNRQAGHKLMLPNLYSIL